MAVEGGGEPAPGWTAYPQGAGARLNHIGEFDAANRTLSAVAKLNNDVEYRRLYRRTTWQTGRLKDLGELLLDVSPADPASDSQLLVFKALLLNKPETIDQHRPLSRCWASTLTDDVAAAWAPLFREVFMVAEPDPVTVIKFTDEALLYLPGEPHILFVRGSAHLSLDGPLRRVGFYWQQSADTAQAWSMPPAIARTYASMGRGADAIRSANEAMRRAEGSLEASITMAIYSLDERREQRCVPEFRRGNSKDRQGRRGDAADLHRPPGAGRLALTKPSRASPRSWRRPRCPRSRQGAAAAGHRQR